MAEHEHAWRQHCPRRVCSWRHCLRCGLIQCLNTGRTMDGPKRPLSKDGK